MSDKITGIKIKKSGVWSDVKNFKVYAEDITTKDNEAIHVFRTEIKDVHINSVDLNDKKYIKEGIYHFVDWDGDLNVLNTPKNFNHGPLTMMVIKTGDSNSYSTPAGDYECIWQILFYDALLDSECELYKRSVKIQWTGEIGEFNSWQRISFDAFLKATSEEDAISKSSQDKNNFYYVVEG